MQSRDNYLGRFTAPTFRVFAKPSRRPGVLQQTRSHTLPQAKTLCRCVTNQPTYPSLEAPGKGSTIQSP
jgi:hypothetical protein